jgi:hypothetical protein
VFEARSSGNKRQPEIWGKYSKVYTFLSITAKTLLEVFFLGVALNYQQWKHLQPAAATCSSTDASCFTMPDAMFIY